MANRIPPLLLVIVFAGLIGLASATLPRWPGQFTASITYQWLLAAVIALAGSAVVIAGVVSFRRARTTMNPLDPSRASSLVTSGIYRVTRNPMYLGFAAWLVALCIALGNVPALLLVAAFVMYMNRFQIAPEEEALRARFGERFDAWCANVRRWI